MQRRRNSHDRVLEFFANFLLETPNATKRKIAHKQKLFLLPSSPLKACVSFSNYQRRGKSCFFSETLKRLYASFGAEELARDLIRKNWALVKIDSNRLCRAGLSIQGALLKTAQSNTHAARNASFVPNLLRRKLRQRERANGANPPRQWDKALG